MSQTHAYPNVIDLNAYREETRRRRAELFRRLAADAGIDFLIEPSPPRDPEQLELVALGRYYGDYA